ncbi:RHS repeat-associated core domain-containing protein [uncultured Bacteroides sp.]|nr:RHS repeat-associated core domain-containing protein [uncultured Bacteroides sp.]
MPIATVHYIRNAFWLYERVYREVCQRYFFSLSVWATFVRTSSIPDDATTGYSEMPGYGKRYSGGCKGQLTGNWTARLTSQLAGSTYSVMYYDARYRVIQRKGNNSLNGMEAVYTSYNFEGSPVKEKRVHSVPGQDIITEVRNYTYDLANRLLQTTYQFNDVAPVILVDNVYDEIGRLKTEKRTGHSKLRTDYAYNLRSWTKGINDPLFHQTLNYQESIDGTTPCYNGNISSMTWKSGGSAATNEMGYRFTYDGLSRMKDAIYGEANTLSINHNRFNEQITGYDKMGNILGLLRYGQTSATGYGLVDNLNLVYNGNQLQSVDDHAPNSVYGNGMEFKDNANQPVEYGYDKNGNLTKDLNKNISNIRYNLINLPSQITFSDGNTIDYEYGSDGRKLRTVHQTGNTILTTDYCGNAIYENGSLKLLLTETGYVSFPDKKFHFYLKDHQGNVRVVADKDGKLEETNDYYPFGGTFTTSTSVQPYKYNGKELDRVSGLNLYDYGARYYDATIGRWCMVDSLSEKYYSFNSYNYCGNNPARYVDPDGNGWNEAWPFLKSSLSFSFSIGGQANANVKVMGVNVGLGVNGGSVKIGDGLLTLEKGVSIGVGIFNAENYTRAYELDSWTSVRESGYTVGVPGIIEDHKKTETFDSTGRYFEKTGESNTVDTDYTLGVSASIILGAEISIDLSKMLDFVKELFK